MKYSIMDDAHLVSAYINGKEEAFSYLVNRHKNRVYTTIYLIVKNQDVAEDLLQDTFIKAIHTLKGKRYNEEGKFAPWITRIAHNMAIDYFRKEQRYPHHTLEERGNLNNSLDFSEDSIEKESINSDNINKINALVERLPANQKEVLKMRYYAGMSFKDIAETTDVSINTALGRMRYALINLKKEIEASNIDIEIIN